MLNDKFSEYKSKGNENTSIEQYLEKIRPYLGNTSDDLRPGGEWKIHLTIKINFISSKHSGESQPMHVTCDNIEIMIGNNTNEIINEHFSSLLTIYQLGLEMFLFYTSFITLDNNRKEKVFWCFQGGIKWEHWPEIG